MSLVRSAARAIPGRALCLLALLALAWALVVAITGGWAVRVGPVGLSSRDALRPLAAGVASMVIYAAATRGRRLRDDLAWVWDAIESAAGVLAVVLAVIVLSLGLAWGTFVAGSADSYGYVSQADLWLGGSLIVPQPWMSGWSWPSAEFTAAPLGYRPATTPDAIVPTYPPGLPLLMAGFKLVLGACGPFFVVPFLGAVAVAATFLLARRLGGSHAGVMAAVLVAASPILHFQILWPMSDVPVATTWLVAVMCALSGKRRSAALAGVCSAVATLTRQNLAPLTLVVMTGCALSAPGSAEGRLERRKAALSCAIAAAPGAVMIAIINWWLYGSPFTSGYGRLGDLYAWSHWQANARLYLRWLFESETPVVLLSIVALAVPGVIGARSRVRPVAARVVAGAMIAGVVVSYLFYAQFDDWSYLRFLLPAILLVHVLTATTIVWALVRLPAAARAPILVVAVSLVVGVNVRSSAGRNLVGLRRTEARYVDIARYVRSATPAGAVIICMQHSGSVRYYGNRVTLRYDLLPADWLDRAVEALRARGTRPYILLDAWEEDGFRARFGPHGRLGALGWLPAAQISRPAVVRLYDPGDSTGGVRPTVAIPQESGRECSR